MLKVLQVVDEKYENMNGFLDRFMEKRKKSEIQLLDYGISNNTQSTFQKLSILILT